jgi:hypothetical protein
MTWIRKFVLVIAILWGFSAFSQDTSCLRRTVLVGVFDGGVPVTGLVAADFHAQYRGKTVQIVSLLNDKQSHRILILLDASGSMAGTFDEKWKGAVFVAEQLAEANLPDTSLALYIFGEQAGEQIEFSADNRRVLDRLREIQSDKKYMKKHVAGQTPLRDTMLDSLKLFGSPRAGDEIFAITDGMDNESRIRESALLHTLLASDVRVFFGIVRDEKVEASAGMPFLEWFQNFAETTGGGVFVPFAGNRLPDAKTRMEEFSSEYPSKPGPTPHDIQLQMSGALRPALITALNLDYSQMVHAFRLEISLPTAVTKPEQWKLSLSKDKSHQLKDADILYPHELLPCAAASRN